MARLWIHTTRTTLPLLLVLCLAALTATSVFASGVAVPALATDVIGSPDAAVNGKLAVGSSSVGSKALTVTGVIDFVGAGTVHNYFSQGGGNNMQINTNVDEANTVGDASKSQWKLVMGSSLDQFSIRRSPSGGAYNEDALFFINGSTGDVGIAAVDTGNGASIPFTPQARLDVQATSGIAVRGESLASTNATGVLGTVSGTHGYGVHAVATSSTGYTYGVFAESDSTSGSAVYGHVPATSGNTFGVYGSSYSTSGIGVRGLANRTTGTNYGVYGETYSTDGYGVYYVGGLAGTGTKSAIVDTQDYGWRTLYAVESPQNWFEDFGQATLDSGEAVVPVDPIFAQTVNLNDSYHVFLTPRGDCGLYVSQQTPTSFKVKALGDSECDISFDYRIVAPRLGYEDLRLKPAEDPADVAASALAEP